LSEYEDDIIIEVAISATSNGFEKNPKRNSNSTCSDASWREQQ